MPGKVPRCCAGRTLCIRRKRVRAGLADAAVDAGGALCRGRLGGRQRPHHGAAHGRNPRPAGGDRECRRRGRDDRIAPRFAGVAGRLQFVIGNLGSHGVNQTLYKRPLYNSVTDSPQSASSIRACSCCSCARISGTASGVHRLRQGERGEVAVRLRRRRLHHAHGLRAAQYGARDQHHAYSVSRHRPVVAGSGRRPARLPVRAAADGDAADPKAKPPSRSRCLPASGPRSCRRFRPRRSRGSRISRCLSWNALFLPKGTPEPIVRRLNAAMSQALDTPWVRERLEKSGSKFPSRRSGRRSTSRDSSKARSGNGRPRSRPAASRSITPTGVWRTSRG